MEKTSKIASRSVLLILLLSVLFPLQIFAQGSEEAQLASLAQEAVEAQNDILVTGDVKGSLKSRQAELYEGAIQGHFANLVHRKRVLSAKGNDYKAHKTEVTVTSVTVDGEQAVQTATESVVLALDPALGGPDQTEYTQDHVFEYVKDNGQWRMISDKIVPPPPFPEEIKAPSGASPTVEAPPGYKPDQDLRLRQSGPKGVFNRPQDLVLESAPSVLEAASYSPSAAVNYALTYWSSYNTSQYRTYSDNDCTNFVSQAVRAGGWPFDETGDRTASNTWYYGSFTFTTSYSWAGAHNFNQFFAQSGRGFAAQYFSDLLPGDLVQADWGPSPDGNISHSMVVTSKDANNTIYLTYHSSNTRNRSITDLLASNPGTNWYGLALYYNF